MFYKADLKHGGYIEYEDFMTCVYDKSLLLDEEGNNLEQIFKILDADGTGKINEQMISEIFIPT